MTAPQELVGQLFAIVAPVYICVAVGYGWTRAGRRYDTALITDLIFNIGAPCLAFSSLVGIEADPHDLVRIGAATLLALLVFALIASAVLRMFRLPLTTFVAPMVFPNTGNMGLPVSLFAFGSEGLVLGICFYTVVTLVQFTAGIWLWSGQVDLRQVLRTPLAWSVSLAVIVLLADIPVPGWLLRTTTLLGEFTIPLMQFTLGVTLGSLTFAVIRQSLGLSFLRIGMGVAVGFGLARLMGLEGAARGVFILDCAMPVAVFNYLLAERYNRSPAEVASVVMVSTLVSLVTLPLILAALL